MTEVEGDEVQRRLYEAAEECIGVLSEGDITRSENVRRDMRERLRKRREQVDTKYRRQRRSAPGRS